MMANTFGVTNAIPSPNTIIAVKIGLRTRPKTPVRTNVVRSLVSTPMRHDHAEKLQHRREEGDSHRDDEPGPGKPLDRTQTAADTAESGGAGAAALFPTAPTESDKGKHSVENERGDGRNRSLR
jgi:hypothetical protein